MQTLSSDPTLFTWRGATVRLTPPSRLTYVYLIHFDQPIGNLTKRKGTASHYIGSSMCLDFRLACHLAGTGAAILRHCNDIGVGWRLERLWQFEDEEQARLFEARLKRVGHGPRYCPRCNPRLAPCPLVMLRRGHHPAISRATGKRRSMRLPAPCFVRRKPSRLMSADVQHEEESDLPLFARSEETHT